MVFLREAWRSFTNFEGYSQFSYQKYARTLKYFFIIYTLIFLIGGIRIYVDINRSIGNLSKDFEDKIPEFTFSQGQLTVNEPQPIIIEGKNDTVLAIDTTGEINEDILTKYKDGVFFGKDRMVTRQNMQSQPVMFENFKGWELDKEKLVNLLPYLKWVPVIFVLFVYFLNIIWSLITSVLLALLGSMTAPVSIRSHMKFINYWNTAVYALTLPWFLEMLKNLIYPALPLFSVIKWGAALIIMYQAMNHLSSRQEPQEAA